jgi:hypothetical protein
MDTPLFQANFLLNNAARLFEIARQSIGLGTNGLTKSALKSLWVGKVLITVKNYPVTI